MWHYQVMLHKNDGDGTYYAIHEYFDIDGKAGWTENPVVDVSAESVEELKKMLNLMLKDIDKHGVKDYE